MEAARRIPLQPNSPFSPVGGGMKGSQLGAKVGMLARTIAPPTRMKATSTVTLMATMTLLNLADSETPMTSRTRFHGPKVRLSSLVRVSSWMLATLLRSPIRPKKLLFGAAVAMVIIPLDYIYRWRRSLTSQTVLAIPYASDSRDLSCQHGSERFAAADMDVEMAAFLAR